MKSIFWIGLKSISKAMVLKAKRCWDLPIKPRYLHFNITYQCNLRCRMCNIWKRYRENKAKMKEEMSLVEIESFFQNNKAFLSNLQSVGLTGGEPFLRPDLVEIVRSIHSILPQARVGIQTNGFLPDIILEKLKDIQSFYPSVSLAVSLDGSEETHDQMRGVRGTYKKAINTIRYAKELGIKSITVGMTLTSLNYHEVLDVYRIAEKYNCEFSCFPAEAGTRYSNIGESYGFSEEEKKKVVEELKEFGYHYYMDNLRLFWEGKKKRRTLPCYSGYTSLDLDPYGNVRPCVLLPDIFGNIKEEPLRKMLYSQRAKAIKEKIKNCSCWCQCEVSSSAVVDPFDVLRWFLTSSNKKKFIQEMNKKKKRLL
ncbi:radical SAM protein [bacterium]|nr:radical SAM protein [bacterium]